MAFLWCKNVLIQSGTLKAFKCKTWQWGTHIYKHSTCQNPNWKYTQTKRKRNPKGEMHTHTVHQKKNRNPKTNPVTVFSSPVCIFRVFLGFPLFVLSFSSPWLRMQCSLEVLPASGIASRKPSNAIATPFFPCSPGTYIHT